VNPGEVCLEAETYALFKAFRDALRL